MRVPLLVANWKMHKGLQDAVAYTRQLAASAADFRGTEVVLAPAFTAVAAVAAAARATPIGVAAQTVAADPEGAFTGEVSAAMIKDAGASSVIVGHSERRRLFGETDVIVHRKVRAAIAAGLRPIVCIGETLDERESGQTFAVIDRQITAGLDGFTADDVAGFVLAYEPVWAIGTGRNATTAEAGAVHAHVRGRLRQGFGAAAADACRVIYGGSVRADNIQSLAALPDVDGALVGGASLDVQTFAEIVRRTRTS
jgi:triosephosphate isomerase (TIM)